MTIPRLFPRDSRRPDRAASPSRSREPHAWLQRHAAPQLSALLVRADREPGWRLDAVGGAAVARPRAGRLAAAARNGPGAHVRALDVPRPHRRRARRPGRQATRPHDRECRRHAPGRAALRARGHRPRRDLARLPARAPRRVRERHRDARAPVVRRGARSSRRPRQRDCAELDQLQPVARHRSRHRGSDDRGLRRGDQLRDQRGELPVRADRALDAGRESLRRIARPDRFPSIRASLVGGSSLRDRDADRALAAGPAGWDGDLRDELPDAPPALHPR